MRYAGNRPLKISRNYQIRLIKNEKNIRNFSSDIVTKYKTFAAIAAGDPFRSGDIDNSVPFIFIEREGGSVRSTLRLTAIILYVHIYIRNRTGAPSRRSNIK